MAGNTNHPPKGATLKIEPFRTIKALKKVRSLLKHNLRDLLIFNLGVNTNLRAIDLVNIKVAQVQCFKIGDPLYLRESKTGKKRFITINEVCYRSLQRHLKSKEIRSAYMKEI